MTDVGSATWQEKLKEGTSCPSLMVSQTCLNEDVSEHEASLCVWVLALDDSPVRLYGPEIRKPKSEYKVTTEPLATL